jgi:hypothetical protein
MFDYFKLIDSTIKERPFFNGVHKGLITLLVKTSEKKHIGNWHPIILLNVSYKDVYKSASTKITTNSYGNN